MRISPRILVLIVFWLAAGCGRENVTTAPPPAPGAVVEAVTRRVLVLYVTQRGAPTPELDRGRIENQVFRQVRDFYDEASYGRLRFEPEFFGWYAVWVPAGRCQPWGVMEAAVEAADADVDFGRRYSHLVVITAGWGCASSGTTSVPPDVRYSTAEGGVTLASSVVEAGHVTPLVVVHELGHQLHLVNEAGFLACGWQALRYPVSQCFLQRYGDFYSAMGGGAYNYLPPRHFNAPEKEALGFFAAGDVQEVRTNGRYTIAPLETPEGAPKALKLRAANGTWIYVEYRQPVGWDAGMDSLALPDGVVATDVYDGALLHLRAGTVSYLLDAGAATAPGDWNGCVLRPGETFTEPVTGDSITVVNRTPSSLTVDAVIHSSVELVPERVPAR